MFLRLKVVFFAIIVALFINLSSQCISFVQRAQRLLRVFGVK